MPLLFKLYWEEKSLLTSLCDAIDGFINSCSLSGLGGFVWNGILVTFVPLKVNSLAAGSKRKGVLL